MYKTATVSAVILAAGSGRRMGNDKNKLLLSLEGKSILSYTTKLFYDNMYVDELILVAAHRDKESIEAMLQEVDTQKKSCKVIMGGDTRQESSFNGVVAATGDILLIHDGARPFASQALIERTIDAAMQYGAAVPVLSVTDTIKIVSDGFIASTVDRHALMRAQTPQGFRSDILRKAHEQAQKNALIATDDSFLVEQAGFPIKAVEGESENIKLTVPADMVAAGQLLKRGENHENWVWI